MMKIILKKISNLIKNHFKIQTQDHQVKINKNKAQISYKDWEKKNRHESQYKVI